MYFCYHFFMHVLDVGVHLCCCVRDRDSLSAVGATVFVAGVIRPHILHVDVVINDSLLFCATF